MFRTLFALLLMSAPAAGASYCAGDGRPYHIEEIPHGYAIVRAAYSDFCKQDHMSDDPSYICDGRADYQMGFEKEGENLEVTMPDGSSETFEPCR